MECDNLPPSIFQINIKGKDPNDNLLLLSKEERIAITREKKKYIKVNEIVIILATN